MGKKLTLKEVIDRANKVHNFKYVYTKSDYERCDKPICIICSIHGEFMQTPHNHLMGQGCPKCKGMNISSLERIERVKMLYNGFYDYSKSDFSKAKLKTVVICPIHGEFITDYDHHCYQHQGCPKCQKNFPLTQEDFLNKLYDIFGDEYDYSKVEYINMHTKVKLVCKEHGEFERTPIELIYYNRGCPKCRNTLTSLETQIECLLIENDIKFNMQKSFDWLGKLSLDFYLPEYNVAIECQGKQHFGLGGWSKNYNFEEQFERDKRKYDLCVKNSVKMLYFSNMTPNFEYFDKVFTDKDELLKSL